MKSCRILGYASIIAATSALGCGGERVQSPPASPSAAGSEQRAGAMERQGPSKGTPQSSDENGAPRGSPVTCASGASAAMTPPPPAALLGVRPDGTPVPAESIATRTGMIRVPQDAILTSSAEVSEIDAFPEEVQQAQGGEKTVEASIAAHGIRRRYASSLSFEGTVDFFDRSLGTYGFQSVHRVTPLQAVVWLARCPGGETAHVTVHPTTPPMIEVVEAVVK